ncbi:MAG: RNA polymerase sigma factor [Gemmatimonadales bacterium]
MLTPSYAIDMPFVISALTPERAGDRLSPASDDRALLGQIAGGDERALGLLYDRYSALLYAVAYRIVGERADAEEIVLEAFSQVWRTAGRFQGEKGSVVAWLTMIGRSRALDLVRARGRRARVVDTAAHAEPDVALAMGRGPEQPGAQVADKERAARVAEAMDGLSAPQRQAIELAFFEGLSHSEIAERLDQPLGTIKTRVRLAMEKLRDALRPYYFEAAS